MLRGTEPRSRSNFIRRIRIFYRKNSCSSLLLVLDESMENEENTKSKPKNRNSKIAVLRNWRLVRAVEVPEMESTLHFTLETLPVVFLR